jgi:hypothetical protein
MPESSNDNEILSEIKSVKKLPHLSELAENFVRVAGGPSALAKLLYEEFAAAAEGSLVRQRILDIVTRVWKFASESDDKPDDTGMMTDEDLDREISSALGQIKERQNESDRQKSRRDATGTVCDAISDVVDEIGVEFQERFAGRDSKSGSGSPEDQGT